MKVMRNSEGDSERHVKVGENWVPVSKLKK